MSKIKTVTHEGEVYQIGGVYEFSDEGIDWYVDSLISIDDSKKRPVKGYCWEWKLIKKSKRKIGTVTPAPVELVDGAAYMFDYHLSSYVGIYEKTSLRFIQVGGFTLSTNCTNIRLMTVGSE